MKMLDLLNEKGISQEDMEQMLPILKKVWHSATVHQTHRIQYGFLVRTSWVN